MEREGTLTWTWSYDPVRRTLGALVRGRVDGLVSRRFVMPLSELSVLLTVMGTLRKAKCKVRAVRNLTGHLTSQCLGLGWYISSKVLPKVRFEYGT